MEKRIEVVTRRVGDLKLDFGNPRKIKKQRKKDLQASLELYGDFDIIVINEENQVIGGNQRVTIYQEQDPEIIVTCKMLVGYTVQEQKLVNVKLNTHAGDWDLDVLNDWGVDNMMDSTIKDEIGKQKPLEERDIKEMELIHYEKYDYVMIVCRNELDYNNLVRSLGIEGAKVRISKRKINARAVWYDKMNATIVPLDELKKLRGEAEDEPVTDEMENDSDE